LRTKFFWPASSVSRAPVSCVDWPAAANDMAFGADAAIVHREQRKDVAIDHRDICADQ
jgi:hypothetical protein